MPAPGPDTFITYCGPTAFERQIVTWLKELKYTPDMYMKFWLFNGSNFSYTLFT